MDLGNVGYLNDFPSFIENGAPPCSQTDPDIFHPVDIFEDSRKNIESYSYEREAKAICAECPFKAPCAAYALERLEVQGIWGGTTQMDRRRMMRRLRSRK